MAWWAAATTWRVLHPARREPYLERSAPSALTRLYYDASDGWRAPLFRLPACPGGAGEPVILLHPLGMAGDGYRYGEQTLAGALSRLGFEVYLLAHRGDRSAVAPPDGGGFCFDDIVERDLPAALERAALDAGYPRVHLVGHGLGGQLALALAARRGARLASVVALAAAVRFRAPRSRMVLRRRLAMLLPRAASLRTRRIGHLLAPMVDAEADWVRLLTSGVAVSSRLRGILQYANEDIPLGLVRQVLGWMDRGSLTTDDGHLDYTEALVDALVPLLAMTGSEDRVCSEAQARPAVELWGHPDRRWREIPGYGHLDLLVGERARQDVFAEIGEWLSRRRKLAWGERGTVAGPCTASQP